jgi:transposase
VSQLDKNQVVWVDECGINQELYRLYGRSPCGQRIYDDISGNRIVPRISMIAAYCDGRLLAPFRFDGYTDAVVFNLWLEKCLLPELTEDQVVVVDNATFHKSTKTRQLIQSVKCHLLFQPAYSPDLNKIEPQWANLKQGVRTNHNPDLSLHQKLDIQLVKMSEP